MNKTPPQLNSRNKIVQSAYFAMLKVATQLLSTIEREELRYTLVREDKLQQSGIIHEFVNPLLYLRLEWYRDDSYGIYYGFEPCKDYAHITVAFTRSVYRLSMKDATPVNIENSIRTEWYIHNPDEMYQYIEEQNKYHSFRLIKHKPSTSRRKQMKAVA